MNIIFNGRERIEKLIEGPPTLNPEDILYDEKKDILGSGSFGKVYRGIVAGLPVAIKVPNKQVLSEDEKESFMREIGVMKKVFHPNIVLFLGASTEKKIMIVSELMACDLETLLYCPNKLPESLKIELTPEIKLKLCTEMALSVNWLHNVVGMVHRDLKPENFMVDNYMNIKVTDFGFTVFPADVKQEEGWKGTPYYLAKEVVLENKVTFSCDVYALGLIMWQTFTQKQLFPEYDDFDEYSEDVICGTKRPEIDSSVPKLLVKCINSMWDGDYTKRPNIKEVLETLQHVSLESALIDDEGLKFWKKHFYNNKTGGLRLEVEKQLFFKELGKELNIKISNSSCLYQLFDEKIITPTIFQKSIDFYGKYFKHMSIFNELVELTSASWYAFDITREIATSWLDKRQNGCFLVRLSSKTVEHPFVISYILKNEIKHNRVTRITTKNVSNRYSTKNIINGTEIVAKTITEIINKCIDAGMFSTICPHEKIQADTYS
ncbi:SH2protein kinase domain containing protein [Entamoeba histolytica KU27]|uniref:SH2protein kinase domain containing protein n=1 Tax=Entamoeba histolytica KU27 TaxID=885311 RepID=M2QEJ6_ENTHI|nr:SH2protein kinase domain containing protein [Entamoeba histolytica KU27]